MELYNLNKIIPMGFSIEKKTFNKKTFIQNVGDKRIIEII